MAKSTNAEISIRVQEVEDLFLLGKTRHEILRYGQKWGVCDDQLDWYMKEARIRIQEVNRATLEENRSLVLRNLWDLYRVNREIIDGVPRNLAEARQVLTQISKVTGLEDKELQKEMDKPLTGIDVDSLEADALGHEVH